MTIAPEIHGSEELADILEEHHIVVVPTAIATAP